MHALDLQMKPCKKCDAISFKLVVGGRMYVCARCKKILQAPAHHNLERDEIDALVDYAVHLRSVHAKDKKK